MASRHAADLTHQLKRVPLFAGVPGDGLVRIIELARAKQLGRGGVFFREGEAAEWFFVLTSGRVKVTQLTPEGHRVMLHVIKPGETFGAVGAFGDLAYPVSAEAAERSSALAWTSKTMQTLLGAEPTITTNALRMVAGRIHDLHCRYRQALTERVERRVARAVLRLVQDAGRQVDAGMEIGFPVSRQDIAEMAGTTLYAVSRLISAWQARGLVRAGRQRLVLAKPKQLVAIAEDLPSR